MKHRLFDRSEKNRLLRWHYYHKHSTLWGMKIVSIVCALFLVALWCVPAVSAGGMVKFHIPEGGEAKVGDTVTVTIYNDNNLNPPMADLSLYLDWNMEVLKFESAEFRQGRTTVANLVGLHNINVRAGETTSGFPQGDNPLIELKYKVIGPGFTPIMLKVDRIHDLSGADITSKAVVKHGSITGIGTAIPTTTGTMTTVTTVLTTGTTTAPSTVPTTAPTSAGTTTPVTTAPTATSLPTTIPTSASKTPVTSVPIVPGPATVPGGTGIFSVSSVGNVPVGGMGTVQLVVDNAWTPLFSDTYIDLSFDPSMIRFLDATIRVANTTAALPKEGTVRIMLGDFRNGYPQGKYPIADMTFLSLREGTTPLTVSVDHVRYWNSDFTQFTDISSSALTQNGVFSSGPVDATVPTFVPVTENPTVTYATPLPVTSYPTSAPVSSGGGGGGVDEYTGVRTKTPTPTPTPNLTVTMTVPTLPPTTVTTVETPVETPTQLELQTTVPPTTVTTMMTPTPTPTKSALPFGVLALVSLAGVALIMQRARR